MSPIELELSCDDFLKDNQRLYAHRARRKKIGMIRFQAVNKSAAEMRLDFSASKLLVANKSYSVVPPETIVRKLSEFTWDFLLYLILDFHPLLAAVDIFFFLSGSLYNRRLRKQLRPLADGETLLKPGESREGVLGFKGFPGGTGKLQLHYSLAGAETRCVESDLR